MRPVNLGEPLGSYFNPPGYSELLASMEHEIVLRYDDDDYQGDSHVLLRDGNRYGMLTFGWGSCSGCDALEACGSAQEVTELRDNLYESIVWLDGLEGVKNRIENTDWDLKHSFIEKSFLDYLNAVAELAGSGKRFTKETS